MAIRLEQGCKSEKLTVRPYFIIGLMVCRSHFPELDIGDPVDLVDLVDPADETEYGDLARRI